MDAARAEAVSQTVSHVEDRRYEPMIPIGWRWLLGFYLGIPLLLVVLRPEIIPHRPMLVLSHLGSTMIVTIGIGLPLHLAYAWLMPRLLPKVTSTPLRWLLHITVILTCVVFGKEAVTPLARILCTPLIARDKLVESLIAVCVACVVVPATTSYTRLQRRARDIERRAEEAQQAALRAQLEALQARTNPHFLFNSLNTVASLIPTDPLIAEQALERLAGLFRYTLDAARRSRVKLGDELDATRDYLDIEALRLGDRLEWSLRADDALLHLRILPLTLQPLVENAVLHGIAPRRAGGRIDVHAQRDGDQLVLTVCDDGLGDGASPHSGTGTAMRDLSRRLELEYGQAAYIERDTPERGGYQVTVRFPLELAT